MPHPGFVILDSPLLAYKEPMPDDENITATDLKPRFYEHLKKFSGEQQILPSGIKNSRSISRN
jgi:hypothetical protein